MPHGKFARTLCEVLDQKPRYGDLVLRGLGQRDADRVADAVGQQRADAHGALDASFESVSGLGHSEVDRIVHPLGLHGLDQKSVGGDHHARVARLHRHDHLVERLGAAYAQELHRRDHHALWRISPLVEDPFGERPVVYADAECNAALTALVDKRFQFAVVGAVVARVDADFFHIPGRNRGHFGHEMDVGNGGRAVSLLAEPCDDPLQVLGFAPSLSREAYDLAACAVDALDLCNAGFGVVGVGVGHRLHGDRVIAADGYVADAYAAGRPASEFRKIHCFTCFSAGFRPPLPQR